MSDELPEHPGSTQIIRKSLDRPRERIEPDGGFCTVSRVRRRVGLLLFIDVDEITTPAKAIRRLTGHDRRQPSPHARRLLETVHSLPRNDECILHTVISLGT